MIDTSSAEVTLRLARMFSAPRERVFRAWTDPVALAAWWWPWNPSVQIDPRPGGAYRFTADMPGAGDQLAVSGQFLTVEPPDKLAYTFVWDGDEGFTRVSVEFRAVGETTEVMLVHTGFCDVEERDSHGLGWHDCLDRLEDLVAAPLAGSTTER